MSKRVWSCSTQYRYAAEVAPRTTVDMTVSVAEDVEVQVHQIVDRRRRAPGEEVGLTIRFVEDRFTDADGIVVQPERRNRGEMAETGSR